ncbi:MAG: hypothetical protein WD826_08900 [Actinomycetota bacterium]
MKGAAVRVTALIMLASVLVVARSEAGPAPLKKVLDGKVSDWTGATTRLGGTWQVSRGEFVYQDHIYDDLGAETRQRSQQHGSATGAPSGDYRYPSDEKRFGNNAADLLELRIAADRTDVWILARMNTLKAPDTTVVAIGIDSDRRTTTGGGAWPFGAGLDVPGVDRVITLRAGNSTVTKLPDGKPARTGSVAVNTTNDHNAIEARLERSVLGGDRVRVYAATGLWDKTGEWMAPQPGNPTTTAAGGGNPIFEARAFNVAFRDNETGSFMEEVQAAALMSGDISAFKVDLDVAALAERVTRPYKLRTGHFHVVVMDQKITIPPLHEGVAYDGIDGRFQGAGGAALTQEFSFYGRHQPYGLYVPKRYDGKTPLGAALALHGHGGSHSTYNSQPGFVRDMGDAEGTKLPPLFLITPLARGSSFYADWGEADTLAVLRDVFSRFRVDRSRLYLTGYSMGGYGVYRLASLYPDAFAAAASWAGYSGEFTGNYLTDPRWIAGDPTGGASDDVAAPIRQALAPTGVGGGRAGKAVIGDPVETMENLRHLPLVHLAGTNDEIVPTTGQYAAPRRLAELGYRSRFDLYFGYEHFSFALVDDWTSVRAWLGNTRRVSAPRDITYRFSDGWTQKGLATSLGLDHGDAWWLRDMTMRKTTTDALELAAVKATSRGIAGRSMTPGSSRLVVLTPTPHLQNEVKWQPGKALPGGNRLDLETTGVGSLTIDVTAAKLKLCGLQIALRTDGPLQIKLVSSSPKKTKVVNLTSKTTQTLTLGC